jgi:hypothetical protein
MIDKFSTYCRDAVRYVSTNQNTERGCPKNILRMCCRLIV